MITAIELTEAELQKQIIDYLRIEDFLVFSFAARGTHRGLKGSIPDGWPDLVAIRDGRHIYFEVKSRYGRLTDIQRGMHWALRSVKVAIYLVKSLEDVQTALREEGYELRAELM